MRSIWSVSTLVLLAGCAAPIETKPVAGPLAPAALPERQVGDTFTYLNESGQEVDTAVVTVDRGQVSWQSTDGWQWTTLTPFGGNSSTAWKGPEGDGQQAYLSDPGALFPLEVGKTVEVSYEGVNAGEPFKGGQRCTVRDEAQVEVPAGVFDTFVVVCVRGGDLSKPHSTRTYYYAPEVGAAVVQVTEERGRSTKIDKLVRHGAPGS